MQLQKITQLKEDIVQLIEASQRYQKELYPSDSIHQVDFDRFLSSDAYFLAAYLDNVAIGIGGFRKVQGTDNYAEIKNLYVSEGGRGLGVATQLMNQLEQEMLNSELFISRLETGIYQPDSVALYEKLGYSQRGPFGGYKLDQYSIFMEKILQS